ncbi:MAG: Holliday junction resolvase RuvX [Dehalococcoidales bacterium]|nr:MAG: Holliday junction resolvase RuvX [Dehalococcoidales bacterium]
MPVAARGSLTRILGLDIGDKRIGVALSDQGGVIASPLTIIHRTNLQQDIEAVITLINQNKAGIIVSGLPLTMDGTIGHQAEKVRSFTDALAKNIGVPVIHRDESLTTLQARQLMQRTRTKKKREKEKDDSIAAAFILQGYLDEQRDKVTEQ